jgi:hypothetical protein
MKIAKVIKVPLLGRFPFRFEIKQDRHGASDLVSDLSMQTRLSAVVFDKNGRQKAVGEYFGSNKLERLWYKVVYRNKYEVDLGSGLVTTAGVVKLSQDTAVSAGSAAFNAFKNVGTGTGTTAAAVGDTALQTAIGTTATAGANTNATVSTNATVTNITTVAYSGTAAVTEWGLFNSTTLAGATMWDHKIVSALNVVSGDSIQWTYVLTLNSGG